MTFNAADLSGISQVALDGPGGQLALQPQSCNYSQTQPCPELSSGSLDLNTTQLADGAQTLTLLVTNAAGNTTSVQSPTVVVDNNGPDTIESDRDSRRRRLGRDRALMERPGKPAAASQRRFRPALPSGVWRRRRRQRLRRRPGHRTGTGHLHDPPLARRPSRPRQRRQRRDHRGHRSRAARDTHRHIHAKEEEADAQSRIVELARRHPQARRDRAAERHEAPRRPGIRPPPAAPPNHRARTLAPPYDAASPGSPACVRRQAPRGRDDFRARGVTARFGGALHLCRSGLVRLARPASAAAMQDGSEREPAVEQHAWLSSSAGVSGSNADALACRRELY